MTVLLFIVMGVLLALVIHSTINYPGQNAPFENMFDNEDLYYGRSLML